MNRSQVVGPRRNQEDPGNRGTQDPGTRAANQHPLLALGQEGVGLGWGFGGVVGLRFGLGFGLGLGLGPGLRYWLYAQTFLMAVYT